MDENSKVCHVGQKGEIDNQIYFISMCTYYMSEVKIEKDNDNSNLFVKACIGPRGR